ncbi:heat shock protein beta-9 [Poeciliopsis prolifica]|uniref:heat shock protein beta-9 n=1 Tax=Poeciliopsis prolifica TaxID=188132 RepID=UPI002413A114|nr:heat shock protein beta-9 [Poeciliopsis prolifica]
MMSQHRALNSLLADDPFLSQEGILWPLRHEALSSLQQNFFSRRAGLAESLLRELHAGPQLLKLAQFPVISSTLKRLCEDREQQTEAVSTEPHRDAQQTSNNSDLLVTLDARGYAPGDITVKLEGRSLAVVAMKQAGAEESQSCSSSSSSSSSASFSSSASSHMGFMQRIDLPAHLDLSGLSCSLMDDGQLRIHAPVARQPIGEEQQVPVRYRTSLEFPIKNDDKEQEHKD